MKILQIVPELKVGGVERGVVDLCRVLIKRGHTPYVISNGGELVRQLERIGAVHYALPVHKKNPVTILRMIFKLAQIIDREQIDVVHARSRVPAWIGFFAAFKSQRPFITTCHGYYSKHFFSKVMGWGKFVIANSNVVANHMTDDFGVLHDKIRVIPRGVDLNEFQFSEVRMTAKGDWVVALIGRMTPLKGHLCFLKAMAKVVRVVPHLKIVFIGDAHKKHADYKEEVRLMTKRLGLERYTEFMGNREDVGHILKKVDLVVLPTIKPEAFGRVLIEAGACGVPVVASKVGGIVEVIQHNKTGLLVKPEDPDELSAAVISVLRDRSLAKKFANNLRQRVEEHFSLQIMAKRLIDAYEEAVSRKKILIIKIGAVGDVILAIPSIRAIREKYKNAHITVLVGEAAAPIMRRCPYIDNIMVYERENTDAGVFSFLKFVRKIKRESFDMSFDFQNSARSHFLSYAGFIPKRYGYKNKKLGFLLNHQAPVTEKRMRPVSHQFHMLGFFGISSASEELEFWIGDEDRRSIDELLKINWAANDTKMVGINPGASARWLTKRWPVRNFARLCDELAKMNIQIVFTGTEEDKEVTRRILSFTRSKPIDLCGKTTVFELAALIEKCAVFVTADSAPMHIAASVKTPFVALFGPTDPKRHLPPSKNFVALNKRVKCAPCYKPECSEDFRCMKRITVEEVLKAVKRFL